MGSTGFFWPKVGADQCRVPLPQAEREKMLKQREEQQLEVGRNTGCKNPYGRVHPKIYMEVAVHVGLT